MQYHASEMQATRHRSHLKGFVMKGDTYSGGRGAQVLELLPLMSAGLDITGADAPDRIVRFGVFEFDQRAGELRKHGLRIKLQGQPVDVLLVLLERPGEVVTRDELQKRLWAVDTYVDFEHSLNAAIKRLRAALGDSADAPRFVETLPRRGYRFIAPLSQPAASVPQAGAQDQKSAGRRIFVLAAAAMVIIVLLITIGLKLPGLRDTFRNRTFSGPVRSLAVLPLANLSGDPGQDYFVDGMTDALRQHLEGISSLRVISRTSSMHYRGSGKQLPDIARELKVDAIVEGSVLRSGDRIRINVELIQAGMDRRLWSNSYERDLRDVFALQADVALSIADEIRVTLTPPDRARLARVHISNPDAYQAYSKGRFFWNKRTEEDLKKAIGFFQQAVDKDPDYALAYDGLADCWLPLAWYGYLSPSETLPHAKVAVNKALSLDDSLAEAHTSLAFVSLYYDRDWTKAEREFRRAIALNPNYANGHHWYAEYLTLVGRHKQAIAESERARELDPLSTIINTWLGSRYFFARQYDKAIEEYRNALEMDPNFAPARLVLGHAYEQKGMLKEAIAEFERAVSLGGGSPVYTASLAHAFGVAGRRAEAVRMLEDLKKLAQSRFVSSYDLALAHLGLAENDQALELLSVAVKERSPRVEFLGVEPRFDGLRADPRFKKLLLSVGLKL
jgi:TolB-like protein/DNA-binding winged helix-turn-helix (wHTH) protein/tetratricopeptide (TPR) repeat protein